MSQEQQLNPSGERTPVRRSVSELTDLPVGAVPQGAGSDTMPQGSMTSNMTTRSPGEVYQSERQGGGAKNIGDTTKTKAGGLSNELPGTEIQGN